MTTPIFTCPRCTHPRSQKGCGIRLWQSMRRRVCRDCAAFIDRAKRRTAVRRGNARAA